MLLRRAAGTVAAAPGLLSNRVVIVTGALRGLGAGIARVCAREGAELVLVDRDGPEQALEASQKHVFDSDGPPPDDSVAWVTGSVTDPTTVDAAENAAREMLQRSPDKTICLVNNAGVDHRGSLASLTSDEMDEVLATNTKAALLFAQATLRLHREQRIAGGEVGVPGPREAAVCGEYVRTKDARGIGPCTAEAAGAIVLVSSVQATASFDNATLYASTKAAATGIVASGAVELAADGMRINGVLPTVSGTRRVWGSICEAHGSEEAALAAWAPNLPLGRPTATEEVGDACAWLLSSKASGVTGTMLPVDCGNLVQLVSRNAANT